MSKRVDLVGKVVGKLTVTEYAYTKNNRAFWKCKCECGNECVVTAQNLISGTARSCGCLKQEAMRKVATKHGIRYTRLYSIWCNMKHECSVSENLRVCDEWANNAESFYNWAMLNGYEDGLALSRINEELEYSPENCEWTTKKRNSSKKSSKMYTYAGKTQNISAWAEEYGLKFKTLSDRLRAGWDIEKALTTPPKH